MARYILANVVVFPATKMCGSIFGLAQWAICGQDEALSWPAWPVPLPLARSLPLAFFSAFVSRFFGQPDFRVIGLGIALWPKGFMNCLASQPASCLTGVLFK